MDVDGYRQLMEGHKEISRGAAVAAVGALDGARTEFVGYEKTEALTAIAALEPDEDGRFRAKLHESPFYAEGGGQVSDVGFIEHEETGARAELVGAVRAGDDQTLLFEGEGFAAGDRVRAVVSWSHRFPTMANHTATHLLHKALREQLGDHVQQAGSAVRPDKLRFDFAHDQALTAEERRAVERRVNEKVFENVPVLAYVVPLEEAKRMGATMLFTESYPEDVRVIEVPGYSMELCGGTHVSRTAEIGPFTILSESSVASGVRRIEAVTSGEAYALLQARSHEVDALKDELERVRKEKPRRTRDRGRRRRGRGEGRGRRERHRATRGRPRRRRAARPLRPLQAAESAGCGRARFRRGRPRAPRLQLRPGCCGAGERVRRREGGGRRRGRRRGGRPTMARAGGTDPEKLADALAEAERLVVGALTT